MLVTYMSGHCNITLYVTFGKHQRPGDHCRPQFKISFEQILSAIKRSLIHLDTESVKRQEHEATRLVQV